MITSPVCRGARGLLAGFALAASLLAPVHGVNAEGVDRSLGVLPSMFDARERLARPDLSELVRLRILTSVDFPPFNFADQTGRLAGFNVDLAREVCAELKLEARCQIQALPFEELETALEGGGGEVVMAGFSANARRRDRFLFSRPYIGIPARFVRSRKAQIKGEGASALVGRKVGVLRDTAHQQMLKAYFPGIVETPFENDREMTDALKDGTVDAVFADGLRLSFWVSSEASADCCALFDGPYISEKFLGEGMSAMIRRNDPTIVAAFDHALATLSRNGRLQDLYLRYFPNGLY